MIDDGGSQASDVLVGGVASFARTHGQPTGHGRRHGVVAGTVGNLVVVAVTGTLPVPSAADAGFVTF